MPDDHAHCPCVERLTAENEALKQMRDAAQDDAHEAWLASEQTLRFALERDALQARIDAALALCETGEFGHWDAALLARDVRAALTGGTP
jgi:hypothetical protein